MIFENETITEYIFALLQSLPETIQLLTVIFIAPLMYLLYKILFDKDYRDGLIDTVLRFKGSLNFNKISIDDLKKHEFFSIDKIHSQFINTIDLGDSFRNDLFRHLFKLKSEVFIRELLISIEEIPSIDAMSVRNWMKINIATILCNVDTEVKSYFKEKFDNEHYEEAYEYIYIDKFKGQYDIDAKIIDNSIESIAASDINNVYKIYMFLNLIYIHIDMALLNYESVFKNINGKINELKKYHK